MTLDGGPPSGNLLADRRFLYGVTLAAEGDHAAAADLFAQAVEIAPQWAAGWFALGDVRARANDRAGAITAFQQAAVHDPADALGAQLALAALGVGDLPGSAGPAHMRALFDEYAPRFDTHLTGTLAYRGPTLLRAALDSVAATPRVFARVLDLGCGTGLMGDAIRDRAKWLAGVDLSPNMVSRAKAKALYDRLEVGDMTDALRRHTPLDLVLAADVLIYVGDLGPIFAAVANALTRNGLFVFTVQCATDGSDVTVGVDHRFAHSEHHLRQRANEVGLSVASCEPASARRDAGRDVPGLVVVLTKSHFGRT